MATQELIEHVGEAAGRYRHAYLLAGLLLLMLLHPFLVERVLGLAMMDIVFLITTLTAIFACATRKLGIVLGVLLGGGMQLFRGLALLDPSIQYLVASHILGMLFFSYVSALLLKKIFTSADLVTADSLCGAVSVYLLLGVIWAMAFTLLEVAQPGSFSFGAPLPGSVAVEAAAQLRRFIGFSFVTLTTLGYGNIVPATPRADALATTEAVVGQLYLTVLVARLVAVHVMSSQAKG